MNRFILLTAIWLLLPYHLSSTPLIIRFKPHKNGVELSWTKVNGAEGYNLYRSDSRFGDYQIVSASPVKKTSFSEKNGKYAYYKIAPIIGGLNCDRSNLGKHLLKNISINFVFVLKIYFLCQKIF